MRKKHSLSFLSMFYTLLFLVMFGQSGCGGGGSPGGKAAQAAKVLVSISIQPADNKLAVGKTQQFTVIGNYTDGTTSSDPGSPVNWSSSSTSVATITPNGMVTAVAAGQTTITATLGDFSNTTTLTVPATVLVSITISPFNPTIAINAAQQFTATGAYSDGTFQVLTSSVTWNSSDTSKATIAPDGKAAAVAAGSTTITATLGTDSAKTTLNVTPASLLSIAVTPSNPVIDIGTTQQFSATGTFSDNATRDLTAQVTWSSSASSIAGITSDGRATAVATGTAAITAAFGVVSGSQNLNVTNVTNVTQSSATGTWVGTYTIYDGVDPSQLGTYTFKLVLNQSGTSVTGTSSLRYNTIGQIRADGHFIEGNVVGGQINFIFTYIKYSREMVDIGTATITDDSMTGSVIENYNGGYICSYIFSLKKL
ncbi:MAG: Ig-like domain-containing protein [Proteobacteria bacterium]|nr:Ig-like domain-containing protein [Pseudomonadota bacterium]